MVLLIILSYSLFHLHVYFCFVVELMKCFCFYNQQDSVGEVTKKIQQCTSPRLLSSGTLNNMHSPMLVAEGMVVAKLKAV